MIEFFIGFDYVSTVIAILATLVLCIMVLKKENDADRDEFFNNCFRQIRTCRLVSIVFAVLLWFLISGREMEECLRLYGRLSVVCYRIGLSWIIFGLITIVFGVYLSFRNRISNNAQKLAKLRGSSFIQGALFLIFAVLLDIG